MEILIMGITQWGRQKEKEFTSGIMERFMMESGTMGLNMVMAFGKV